MNNIIEDFINNKAWIHISPEDFELVRDLEKLLGEDIKFRSGDNLYGKIMKNTLKVGETWFRCEDNAVSYNHSYPRTSGDESVSPWIYENGAIVDIKDVVEANKVEFEENEFLSIFTEV